MIQGYGNSLITLLNGVEATGPGTEYVFQTMIKEGAVQVTFTNSGGSVTVLVVDLEGSIDGTTWFILKSYTLDATELTNKAALFSVFNNLVKCVRANITTLTETGTTTVTAKFIGNESIMR